MGCTQGSQHPRTCHMRAASGCSLRRQQWSHLSDCDVGDGVAVHVAALVHLRRRQRRDVRGLVWQHLLAASRGASYGSREGCTDTGDTWPGPGGACEVRTFKAFGL